MSTYEPQYVYSTGTMRRWFKKLGDVPDTIITTNKKKREKKKKENWMQYERDTKKMCSSFQYGFVI